MLQQLSIQNYAIIESLTVQWQPGLNIITGETGAGKSILMGALSLILGERADTSVLLHAHQKCIVEGYFTVKANSAAHQLLLANDGWEGEEVIVRREISASGKSRAFINDSPVNLDQLKQFTGLLVDLHRQFDTLSLGQEQFQRQVLDAMAGNLALFDAYQSVYRDWQKQLKRWAELTAQQAQLQKEQDYHQYLFDELAEADFQPDEIEQLEQEHKTLANSETILQALARAEHVLNGQEAPLVAGLKQVVQQLQPFVSLLPGLSEQLQRLQSAYVEVKDIAAELTDLADSVSMHPERLQWVTDRLNLANKLLKKHGLTTTTALRDKQAELAAKLAAVSAGDEQLLHCQQLATQFEEKATALAQELHANRAKWAPILAEQTNARLQKVGMPNARLIINVSEGTLQPTGNSKIEYLFDANQKAKPELLHKVASGGELSRLMLCIKSLVAHAVALPTLIFDEIDTGISGEAAMQVGKLMQQLGESKQLICITHQPQIAAKGNAHYFVYKSKGEQGIQTHLRRLTADERVAIVAQMIGGEQPSAAALANAKELLQ